MKQIIDWLENGAKSRSLLYSIPIITFCSLTYGICFFYGLVKYLPGNESCSSSTGDLGKINDLGFMIYFAIWGAAFFEEFLFRFSPIFTIQFLLSFFSIKINYKISILFICIIMISIFFGYLHGNYINVFIQGVSGFIYSLIYLKYGGYYLSYQNSSLNSFNALYISTIFHFFHNITIFFIENMIN